MLASIPVPAATIRAFTDDSTDPRVRGFLHAPETPNGKALVLTHGAGSNAQAPLLIAVADAFCTAGFIVLRCDLPYRQSRSYGPPGPGDAARDRAGLKNAIAAVNKNMGAPFLASFARKPALSLSKGGDFPESTVEKGRAVTTYLGGHSYGGRQSSILCAEEPELVPGLLLLSYPLHPPRKPEQQRTQHLPDLRTPTLFVQGTRDPFGTIAEIEQALKMIPGKTKLLVVEGGGHDLGFKGKAKREELPREILLEFNQTFS
jgi:predicted alpha/beta-hydrolase family hydrolase